MRLIWQMVGGFSPDEADRVSELLRTLETDDQKKAAMSIAQNLRKWAELNTYADVAVFFRDVAGINVSKYEQAIFHSKSK